MQNLVHMFLLWNVWQHEVNHVSLLLLWITNSFAQQICKNKWIIINLNEGLVRNGKKCAKKGNTYQEECMQTADGGRPCRKDADREVALAQHLRSSPRLSNERRAGRWGCRWSHVSRTPVRKEEARTMGGYGRTGRCRRCAGRGHRGPRKVSPQVAIAGVVVGSLLPLRRGWDIIRVVREPSWMERCSPSTWRRWTPSPVGDPRLADGGGETHSPTGTPPPPGGGKDAAARARIGEDSTLPPPGWGAAMPCTFVGGSVARQSDFLFVTALGKEVTWLAGSEMRSNLTPWFTIKASNGWRI